MDASPTDVTVLNEIDMNRDPSTFVGTAGKLNDTLIGAQLMSPPPSRKTKNRSTSSSSRGGALGGAASATPVNAALSDPSIRGSTLVDPSPARRDAAAILKNMFSSTQVGGFGSLMSAESSYIQPSSSYLQPPPSSYTASTTATTATAAAITTSSTRGAGKRKEKRVSKKQSAGAKKSHTQNINSRQGAGGQPYSRKSKSLGLLCTSFIEFYSRPESPAISIDYSATLLGVERRRIYDIINILESVCVVKRRCKNTYDWCGTDGLRDVFRKLMWEGIVEGVEGKDAKWKSQMGYKSIITAEEESQISRGQYDNNVPFRFARGAAKKEVDKDKSLARLSQKFVQMFLTCYNGEGQGISLADASVWILGEGGESNPRGEVGTINQEVKGIKTKVRRLYDIANVMVAIGVIEKVGDVKGEKKPVFGWCWGDKGVVALR